MQRLAIQIAKSMLVQSAIVMPARAEKPIRRVEQILHVWHVRQIPCDRRPSPTIAPAHETNRSRCTDPIKARRARIERIGIRSRIAIASIAPGAKVDRAPGPQTRAAFAAAGSAGMIPIETIAKISVRTNPGAYGSAIGAHQTLKQRPGEIIRAISRDGVTLATLPGVACEIVKDSPFTASESLPHRRPSHCDTLCLRQMLAASPAKTAPRRGWCLCSED